MRCCQRVPVIYGYSSFTTAKEETNAVLQLSTSLPVSTSAHTLFRKQAAQIKTHTHNFDKGFATDERLNETLAIGLPRKEKFIQKGAWMRRVRQDERAKREIQRCTTKDTYWFWSCGDGTAFPKNGTRWHGAQCCHSLYTLFLAQFLAQRGIVLRGWLAQKTNKKTRHFCLRRDRPCYKETRFFPSWGKDTPPLLLPPHNAKFHQ